jgi:hypothetical protein
VATRTLPEAELATAGVGAAGVGAGGATLTKGRRTAEPVHTATAMGADRPATAGTGGTKSRPVVSSGATKPAAGGAKSAAGGAKSAAGGTAAERAAARRGLQRQVDDESGRDNS